MSCDLTSGRAKPCKDGIGGVKEILLCAFDDVTYGAVSAGAIADITSDTTFYRWAVTKNSASLAQNVQSSVENGTIFFEQVLTVNMAKQEASVTAELTNVLRNCLSIIVRDNNDNWHVMGLKRSAEATGGNIGTGAASGDLNGYNLVFTAEEIAPCPFGPNLSDATVVSALTGTVTISPAY